MFWDETEDLNLNFIIMKNIIFVFCIFLYSCNTPRFFRELEKLTPNTNNKIDRKNLFGFLDLKFLESKLNKSTILYVYNKGRLISPNGMPSKLTKAIYIDLSNNKYYEITRNLNNKIEDFIESDIDKNIFVVELLKSYNANKCSSLSNIVFKNEFYSLKHNEYFYEINLKDKIFYICNITPLSN